MDKEMCTTEFSRVLFIKAEKQKQLIVIQAHESMLSGMFKQCKIIQQLK